MPRPEVRQSVGWAVTVANHATVLCSLGRFEEAKQSCLHSLNGETDPSRVPMLAREILTPLAFAEAGLGNEAAAREVMERIVRDADSEENPLRQGNAHRDCALLALGRRDKDDFERHLKLAEGFYRATRHPALLTQLERLAVDAERTGLRPRLVSSGSGEPSDNDGETTIEVANGEDETSSSDQSTTIRAELVKPRAAK